MQSLAQKKSRENFKKAIEYRKKTGCTLKQAFAHVKGKSTVVKKKVTPKKVAIKKAAKKKVGVIKKKPAKKPSEKSILNKIHKVKKDVENLDESQHKHMSIGGFDKHIFIKLESVTKEIDQRENVIKSVIFRKKSLIERNGLAWYKNWLKMAKSYVSELKKHKTELKKHI
jgi:hypothetical protein